MMAVYPTPQASTGKQGFTLLELTIVLGIIAVVTTGILTGQTLNKSATINQAVALHTQFASAWNNFKAIYNAIPGDMPNATEYWDVDDSCPTLSGTASTTGTCNGNGDGHVIWYSYDQFITAGLNPANAASISLASSKPEAALAFKHLELAGLLKGEYYMNPDAVGQFASIEFPYYYIPKFRRTSGAIWFVGTNGTTVADLYYNADGGLGLDARSSDMGGNALQTARFNSHALADQPIVAVETPAIVSAIDVKMDDGNPKKGKFHASNGYAYGTQTYLDCIVSNGAGGYEYNLGLTTEACRFLMSLD